MRKDEIKILFEDFNKQVNEISQHSDKVKKLNFSCSLLNGTSFKFNYNINKHYKSGSPYKPAAIFNAILDIISAIISLVFLLLYFSEYFQITKSNQAINLFIITLLSFSITFFVLRSVYHLFQSTSSVRNPLFRASEAIKISILLNINILVSVIYKINNITLVIFLSFVVCSLALLSMGIGTQGAFKIEMLLTTVLPLFMLVSSTNLAIVASSILLAFSSFIYVLLEGREAKTNSIFSILGISLFILGIFSFI